MVLTAGEGKKHESQKQEEPGTHVLLETLPGEGRGEKET
jgi:hypothetical protein